MRLFDQNWLGDEVINYVGQILQTQYEGKARVFSSHFFNHLIFRYKKYDFAQVRNWHKRVPPSVSHLYIPINLHNIHWVFLRLDFQSKRIQLWDSFGEIDQTNQQYLLAAKKYVNNVKKSYEHSNILNKEISENFWGGNLTTIDESLNSPRQTNDYDYGPFIILLMTIMLQVGNLTKSLFSQEDLYNIKLHDLILQLIYQSKD